MAMPDLSRMMRDETGLDAVFRLRVKPSEPFLLQHRPNSWEVESEGLDGPTWLPILAPRAIKAGANGMRTIKRGEQADDAYRAALARDERQGIQTIPLDLTVSAAHLPDGVPPGRYVRSLDAQDPRTRAEGKVHVEAWKVPMEVPEGQPHRFRFDRPSWNRWRAHLVESGVIAPPMESVRLSLLRRHEARVLSAEVDPLPDEVRRRRVEEKAAIRDGIAAATVPAPKKPRAVK